MNNNTHKDLIILGAGINGLSAGLAYALNNDMTKKRVLIIEKSPVCGGYVTSYARKGYYFDTCQMISNISDILDYFGVSIEWKRFEDDFIRIFRSDNELRQPKVFELCSGNQAFWQRMNSLFPQDAVKLENLFEYSKAMFAELYGLKYAPGPVELVRMLFACPKVIRNASKTFDGYLSMFGIDNPDIKLIFQTFSGFCGLPNDKIAALLTVGVVNSLLENAYRPKNNFSELPNKMEQRFLELGGEILYRSEAEKILLSNGSSEGVRLKNGSVYYSSHIISTVDIKSTFGKMISKDELRALNRHYAGRIENIKMTTSAFTVNLGLDNENIPGTKQLACGYALLTSGYEAYNKLYRAFEEERSALTYNCFNLGISYHDAQENGKPVLSIQAIPVPIMNWKELRETDRKKYIDEKEKTAEIIIGIVEKHLIPDLRRHILVKDISTPATYARYSGSPSGSIYDMAAIPKNFGRNRLPVKTPVKGLLVPKFAHGVFGAMNSGLQSVDILLNGAVMHGNSRFGK